MFTHQDIVDAFFETFDQSSIELFRAYMARNPGVAKWFVSCDFCLHDQTRPNDCFSFSISPYDRPFDDLKTTIQNALQRDIKNTRSLPENAAALLRDGRFFHIAIVLPKKRAVFDNGPGGGNALQIAREVAQLTLDQFTAMERGPDAIARMKLLVQASKANNFAHSLFSDIFLLSIFLPLVSLLIGRERKAEIIGWFSDRDNMTEWCERIVWDFAINNVHGLAALKNIDIHDTDFPVCIPNPDTGDMWFDQLIRLSDYMAGTLAVWDLKNNTVPTTPKSDKFLRVVEDIIANSNNMIVLGFDIGQSGLKWRRLAVGKSLPE